VIRSRSRPRPSRASQPSSRISSRKPRLATAGNARTVFAFSPPTLVVRKSSYQVPASFRLGTLRDVAPCNAPPEWHPPIRSSDVCFPNSRLRLPVLAGSRHRPRDLRLVRSGGLWGPPRNRGRGRTRCVRYLRFGVPHWPLIRGVQPCRGFYPPTRSMRPTSSIPVASPAPVFVGPFDHAFAWVLPGGSCRDRSYRCRVNSNGGGRSEMVSIDRGLFASTSLRSSRHPCPPCREWDFGPPSCAAVAPTLAWNRNRGGRTHASIPILATPVSPLASPPSTISRG
jgi:hypothetical protein